ncbi:MAG: F0F1 ATP synthase subunit alpha, partial [Planctomycetota bacterium]|nr:F0F1 ATP synthase subunit alpha [Planctomycetota bacterium]
IPPMKKNAGSLRLDLAQFRELQAFAQFGSDLDSATQAKLTRGERLVEILKQGQYVPVPVAEQVMIIYAGTSGGLDDLPASRVAEFEQAFIEYVNERHPEVAEAIAGAAKDIPDETKAVLDQAITTVKAGMLAG